jgi:hypothetical protein
MRASPEHRRKDSIPVAGIPVEGDGIEWLIRVAGSALEFFSIEYRGGGSQLPRNTVAKFLT